MIISVMTVILMIIVFVEHTTSNIKMCDDHISIVLSSGMSVDKVLNPGINRVVKKED